MRILQNNIQSINTSKNLVNLAIKRNIADVVLLQEIWRPSSDMIFSDFQKPIIKLRENKEGGGVGIAAHREVKMVCRKEYEVNDLEAVWA